MTHLSTAFSALSPLDGRYAPKLLDLASHFSELGLVRARLMIEIEYLIKLVALPETPIRQFTDIEIIMLREIAVYPLENLLEIKSIESTTNHDVKAIEYYLAKFLVDNRLSEFVPWVHFGLTSEDVNNCAYALMITQTTQSIIIPEIENICTFLREFSLRYKDLPMGARTHGQAASPTTLGKEFAVYHSRLLRQLNLLREHEVCAKLNGATGNYNAHAIVLPEVDWIAFSQSFIEGLGNYSGYAIAFSLMTTQIEPQDSYCERFAIMVQINRILHDLSLDVWRYISDGWLGLRVTSGEVGSSTMPHKVNPIDFENAEGNFGLANSLFDFLGDKLSQSRLQRDLSNSTVQRNIGVAFAYSSLAFQSLQKGLDKIQPHEDRIGEYLNQQPEVLAEAIQMGMRVAGYPDAYERLKKFTRGESITVGMLHDFVRHLNLPRDLRNRLLELTPRTYIGLSTELTQKSASN